MTSHTPGEGNTRVGPLRGSGRRAFYLAEPGSGADALQRPLRSRFRAAAHRWR